VIFYEELEKIYPGEYQVMIEEIRNGTMEPPEPHVVRYPFFKTNITPIASSLH
jgi:hypothetical protein